MKTKHINEHSELRKVLEKYLNGNDEQMELAMYDIMKLFDLICPNCNCDDTRLINDTPRECLKCGKVYFDSI